MPMQNETITKSVDGEKITIGSVTMTITDMVGEEFISKYHASMKVDDKYGTGVEVGSYDTFEEAVEELHKAYENREL